MYWYSLLIANSQMAEPGADTAAVTAQPSIEPSTTPQPEPTAEEAVPDAAAELKPQASVSRVYCVANHPDPSYNGEYQRCGTWNERPAYRLVATWGDDNAEIAHCLYYWRAEIPESDEEEGEAPAVPDMELDGFDLGAGWTFGSLTLQGLPSSQSALVRTKSVAQPPSLGRGDGGCSLEPCVSKMFPPEGTVSFVTGDNMIRNVKIERLYTLGGLVSTEMATQEEQDHSSSPGGLGLQKFAQASPPQQLDVGPPSEMGPGSLAGHPSAAKFFAFGFDVTDDFDGDGRLLASKLAEKIISEQIPTSISSIGNVERNVASIAERLRADGLIGPEHGESFEEFSATVRVCLTGKMRDDDVADEDKDDDDW